MREITINDKKENKYDIESTYYNQDEFEDETETIYAIIDTLLTNKYQNMDHKKIVEEIIYQSTIYETIDELIKTIRSREELKEIHEQYPIIENREEETIDWDEIL